MDNDARKQMNLPGRAQQAQPMTGADRLHLNQQVQPHALSNESSRMLHLRSVASTSSPSMAITSQQQQQQQQQEEASALSQRRKSRDEIEILSPNFTPGPKDIICGRQRENFHHKGNEYFRELIQDNIGPYIGSRTKLEKGFAIIEITKLVRDNSPEGGFVKLDTQSQRWYRIKESEARDKVGHAIRKAVQRLEDTRPSLYARLRKEYSEKAAAKAKEAAKHQGRKEGGDAKASDDNHQQKKPAASAKTKRKKKDKEETTTQLPQPDPINVASLPAQQGIGILPGVASPALLSIPGALPPPVNQFGQGLTTNHSNLLLQSLRGTPTSSLLPAAYNPLLALRLQDQRSQDELALIRALQQQEEANIRREIEYSSVRNLPIYDPGASLRVATATANPLLRGTNQQLPSQLAPLAASLTGQGGLDLSSQLSDLLKKQEGKEEDQTKK